MKVIYEKSIEYQVMQLIQQIPNNVLLRKDLLALGGYRQISRILKKLVNQKKLVKIGFGIYAKAYQSKYISEPLIKEGFDVVSREALDRLGVEWEAGHAEQAYNNGLSQQVPAHNIVQLKSRFRRKLFYANRQLYFEGNINAR